MAAKKRKSVRHSESKPHGKRHETRESTGFERSERGMKGYSRKRESYR